MEDSETNAVADLAREGTKPVLINADDGRQFLVVHNELTATDVTNEHRLFVSRPSYTKQTVALQTRGSLIDYVNRYKLLETTIFANISTDRLDAVIDYHGPSKADYLAHRAHMQLVKSEEWKLWTSIDKRLMQQLEFARFIEENAADVNSPSAGELLDAVRDLQAHRKVNFTKAVRTSSDNENFEFTVDNEAKTKGGLELPTKFRLWIPVYFNEPAVEVCAFLRWKIDPEAGGLTLGIALNRPEFVRQEEFMRIADDVGVNTERPVVYGTLA